jgi:photosystem II stability/assembly factor-like uncharacterized protein
MSTLDELPDRGPRVPLWLAAAAAILLSVAAVGIFQAIQHMRFATVPGHQPTVTAPGARTAPVSTSGHLVYFVSPEVGWRVSDPSDNQNSTLYKTSDGGQHWSQQLTWQGPNPTLATFLSPTEGVIMISRPGFWLIYSTTDGEKWRLAQVKEVPGQPRLSFSFISAQEGWQRAGGQDGAVVVSHTTDGGRGWQEVGRFKGPSNGSNQITFSSPQDGFIGAQTQGGLPQIYITHDGGRTWVPTDLPSPPQLGPDRSYQADEFIAAGAGTVFLRVNVFGPGQYNHFLYTSSDAGRSWSNPVEQRVPGLRLQAIDSMHLVVASDRSTFISGDGGKTWVEHKGTFPSPPPNDGNIVYGPYNIVGTVFVSDQVGWALATSTQRCPYMTDTDPAKPSCPSGGPKSVNSTLKTVDGGATWTLVKSPTWTLATV